MRARPDSRKRAGRRRVPTRRANRCNMRRAGDRRAGGRGVLRLATRPEDDDLGLRVLVFAWRRSSARLALDIGLDAGFGVPGAGATPEDPPPGRGKEGITLAAEGVGPTGRRES